MSVRLREMLDDAAGVTAHLGLDDLQKVALLASMLGDTPYQYRLDDAFGEELLLELSYHLEYAVGADGIPAYYDFSHIRPLTGEAGGYAQIAESVVFFLPTRAQALRLRTEYTQGHRISAEEGCGLVVDLDEEGRYMVGAVGVGDSRPAASCWVGTPAWRRRRGRQSAR